MVAAPAMKPRRDQNPVFQSFTACLMIPYWPAVFVVSLLFPRMALVFPWGATGRGAPTVVYRFEGYSLDATRRELRRGSQLVAVEPLVFDVLEFLVRNRQRTISKDELIGDVWKRRIVSDSTLSSRMTAVRHAIGDSGKEQRLIKTVARRGFRFVAVAQEDPEHDQQVVRESSGGLTAGSPRKPAIAILPFANS